MTDLSRDEVRTFLADYGLTPRTLGITKLEGWTYNLILRLDTENETLVLRRYGMTPPAEVHWELALLAHLNANRFPTISPLSAKNGQYLGHVQDKPAILYPYVAGRSGCAPGVDSEIAIAETAATVASLHDLTEGLTLPHPRIQSGTDSPRAIREFARFAAQRGVAPHETALHEMVELVIGTLGRLETLTSAHTRELRRGIVHHDAHCANTLFQDNRLVALIDFDDACEGYLVADLAVMIANWAATFGGDDALDPKRAALVVREYERHRRLTEAERSLLVDFTLTFLAADASAYVQGNLKRVTDGNQAVADCNVYRRYLRHVDNPTWRERFSQALYA